MQEQAAPDERVVGHFRQVNPLVDGVDECRALVGWFPHRCLRLRTGPWRKEAVLVGRVLELVEEAFREPVPWFGGV